VQEKLKGLEISVIAVVDVDRKQGYPLSVQQTPLPNPNQQRPELTGIWSSLGPQNLCQPQLMSSVMDFIAKLNGWMVSQL
jgi:hypothetical protein